MHGHAYKTIVIISFVMVICFFTISSYHGIAAYFREETIVRSTSLETRQTVEDNFEKIDYIDENGKITFASDKHYASLTRTRYDDYELEEYFDENGNPARQSGYYSIRREFDEENNEYKLVYLDQKGNPVVNEAGYAISERTFDDSKRILSERYYGADGKPIRSQSFGYGRYNIYDVYGNNNVVIYLGADGEIDNNPAGFAILRRSFYPDGSIENDYYYDENGDPVYLAMGQYGIHREHDVFGRDSVITYLDSSGNPILTKVGILEKA